MCYFQYYRYFDNNLPSDNVPFADFDAPENAENPKDSSATAIVASALFELFELTGTARIVMFVHTSHTYLKVPRGIAWKLWSDGLCFRAHALSPRISPPFQQLANLPPLVRISSVSVCSKGSQATSRRRRCTCLPYLLRTTSTPMRMTGGKRSSESLPRLGAKLQQAP